MMIFPLVVFPYISRVINPESIGAYNFSSNIISYLTIICMFGIVLYGTREAAKIRDDKVKLTTFVVEITIINLFFMTISFLLLLVIMIFVPKLVGIRTMLVIQSLTLILSSVGLEWLYQALEKYKYITVRSILIKIISAIMIFSFVKSEKHLYLYIALSIIATAGSNVYNLINARRLLSYSSKTHPNFGSILLHTKKMGRIFIFNIIISIYTSGTLTIIGMMMENSSIAFYNVSKTVVISALSISQAITNIMVPRLSYLAEKEEKHNIYKLLKVTFSVMMYISLFIFTMIFFNANDIINLLGGERYHPAVLVTQILAVNTVLIAISNFIGYQVLFPKRGDKKLIMSVAVGALTSIICTFVGIRLWGLIGAAFACVIAEMSVVLIQTYLTKKELANIFDLKTILSLFIAAAFAATFVYFTRNVQQFFTRFIILNLVAFILYNAIFLLLNFSHFKRFIYARRKVND